MKTILVTDSLFIFSEHEKQIKDAGYEFVRLDKPDATEEEVCEAVKGKSGYILGGAERITAKVIDAADRLEAIVFTGTGYKGFIPGWEQATKKGIAIANTPDGPTQAVAEWALTLALAMNRHILELGKTGSDVFKTTSGIEGQRIGIIGYGRIGTQIGEMIKTFRPKSISYYSLHRHDEKTQISGVYYQPLDKLLSTSDIVFLCVSDEVDPGFIGTHELEKMKDDALLVSFMHTGVINENALLNELKSGRLRAASDYPMRNKEFGALPLSHWFSFNGTNAFNTHSATKLTSDMAVNSLLNILGTGEDQNLVNPEYKEQR